MNQDPNYEYCFELKLADFGSAKQVTDKGTTGTLLGTPVTLAPEIVLRESKDAEYDPEKVDIWAIGCIFYRLIYDDWPFTVTGGLLVLKQCL